MSDLKKNIMKFMCAICFVAVTVSLCSCKEKDPLFETFGYDTFYFRGLQELKKDSPDKKEVAKLFAKTKKKGSPYFSRRSAEELYQFQDAKTRIRFVKEYYKNFSDEDALLFAARNLFLEYEYDELIKLTSDIDVRTCADELSAYRCLCLYRNSNPLFEETFREWALNKPWTKYHSEVLRDCNLKRISVYTFRDKIFYRDYSAVTEAHNILLENDFRVPELLTDCGKALLYGSKKYVDNAEFLKTLMPGMTSENIFYIYFYAGRLYEKANKNAEAMMCYKSAVEHAQSDKSYDNALWYYLTVCLKESISVAVTELEKYAPTWHDKDWYDDFLDTLSLRLVSKHFWSRYYEVARIIEPYASREQVSKYSYVCARLMEEDFFTPKDVVRTSEEKTEDDGKILLEDRLRELYTKALDCDTNIYYMLMASRKLDRTDAEIIDSLKLLRRNESFEKNEDLEKLVRGYMEFGFDDKLYALWLEHMDDLSLECATKVSERLMTMAKEDDFNYYKSIRVASKKLNRTEERCTDDLLHLAYPKNFGDLIANSCEKYTLNEYFLYGLIRCESFFNTRAFSSAAASGLTQFIKKTADEVARKLGYEDYDLTDSATSIEFGAYYLSDLIRRLDEVPLYAIFAYNGGAGSVRSWRRSVRTVFGRDTVPNDLFLEAVPFNETREYGRRVTGAACVYALLYYGQSPSKVIEEIMKF